MIVSLLKWISIFACLVVVVIFVMAYAWQYGHPMNHPVSKPHDYSKQNHISEHQINLKCGWLIECDAVPYKVLVRVALKTDLNSFSSLGFGRNGADAVFPGQFRIVIAHGINKQKIFETILSGRRAYGSYAADQRLFTIEASAAEEPWLKAGSYFITIENLEAEPRLVDSDGFISLQWARK